MIPPLGLYIQVWILGICIHSAHEVHGVVSKGIHQMDTGILLEHLPSRPKVSQKNIIYGVNTEVDSVLYDTHEMIDEKVKYVCESKLGGVFSWRIDNDNRNEKGANLRFR